MRTNKRKLATGAAANWAGFASQLAVAFFVTPLLVHRLGERQYGVWSLAESIIAYLALFDLGLAASLVRYVARFDAQGDRTGLDRVFNTTVVTFGIAGVTAFTITLGLAVPWERPLGVPIDLADETRWILVLLGLKLAVGLPMSAFAAVLDGLGHFTVQTAVRTVGLFVRTTLMVSVLLTGGGLVGMVAAVVAVTIVEDLVMGMMVRSYLPDLQLRPTLSDLETFRSIRGYSTNAFLVMLADRVSFQTDALVIGAFLAPQYIAYFAVAARLVEYSKSSLRAITTVLTPAVSELEVRGDSAAIRRILVDGARYVLYLILPVQVGLLVLGRDFLALWMGAEFEARSFPTLAILAIPLSLVASQSISGRILYGIGQLGWLVKATLLQAVVNVALSVALVGRLGIEGVALGTAVPSVVYCCCVAAHTCGIVRMDFWTYLRCSLPKPLLASSLLAVGWLLATAGAPRSWIALLATGAVGLCLYVLSAIVLEFGRGTAVDVLTSRRRRSGDGAVVQFVKASSNPAAGP